jgi:tetratricopeptide (TPR) repeat protein
VALIGEGQDFRVTAVSRDVTDQIARGLDAAVDRTSGWKGVSVRRVGLVTSRQEAEVRGRSLGVSLVVWGQLIDFGTGSKTLHIEYELLKIPDRAHYPAYPIVLPVTPVLARGSSALDLDMIGKRSPAIRDIETVIAASLGLAAYYNRDYGTAVEQFDHAIKMRASDDRQSELISFYLGRAYQHLGQIETGNLWLERAGDSAPDDPSIPLSIALGHRSLDRQELTEQWALKAKDLASTWLRLKPDDLVTKYDLGLIYGLLQQPEKAVELFDAILKLIRPSMSRT